MSDVSGRLDYASRSAKNKADETMENVRSGTVKALDQASDTFRSKGSQVMEAGGQRWIKRATRPPRSETPEEFD